LFDIAVVLGSSMIPVQQAVDEEGQCFGMTKATPVSIHHLMRDLWQGFVAEGLITQVKAGDHMIVKIVTIAPKKSGGVVVTLIAEQFLFRLVSK